LFALKLARAYHEIDVDDMLARLSSRQIAELAAFDALEPIDHARRAELSAGTICQTLGNIHRDRNHERYTAADFMVEWGKKFRDEVEVELSSRTIVEKIDQAMQRLGIRWE
jgi:hypothetical protein